MAVGRLSVGRLALGDVGGVEEPVSARWPSGLTRAAPGWNAVTLGGPSGEDR
jgi:hypothetical protein